jgi:uncharacterized membrane protein YeaQ/YmgE (transglycosylase-associated protein family)
MAIRMALGSQRSGIIRLVLYSGAKLAAIGCALGLVGAVIASHLLGTFLFQVSALDPVVLVVASVFVLLLTLFASLLPAHRASSIDPMQALRGSSIQTHSRLQRSARMRCEEPAYRGPFVRHSSSDGGLREFAIWIVPSYSDQRMSTVTGAAPTAGRLLIRKRLPFGATAYWKRGTRAAMIFV